MTGANIRAARKAKGMTMKELGALIGTTESAVSYYETGKREPKYETLLMIAEALDTSVGYLMGYETEKAPTENGERKVTDEDIKAAFWGGENDLSQEDIDALWEDARAYIEFKTSQKRGKKRR